MTRLDTPDGADRRLRALYVISVAAELAGVHPQTLRIYERKGLLDPARTQGGSRRYSEHDIEQLRRISELSAEGMNLAGIKRVLELENELQRVQSELARVRSESAEQVAHAERRHRRDLVPVKQNSVVLYGRRQIP
ncbi:MAG: transcriptional regulator, MerR family [Acidimicrobiia bacterium]|nr:transcriptional regulator, MerR family [Acidimicrobiia bacterium]